MDFVLPTNEFCADIENLPFYKQFYSKLQAIAASGDVDKNDFQRSLVAVMKDIGLETELRNEIYHWTRLRNENEEFNCWIEKEPLDYLRKSQMQWEKRIYKSLNSMCNEINVLPSSIRSVPDRNEIMEKWNMLSTYNIDLSQYRPVYAPKDFMEVLLLIQNPNYKSDVSEICSDFSHIPLKVKTLYELKNMYKELTEGKPIIGITSDMITNSTSFYKLKSERIALGQKVIDCRHAPTAQEYLKKGAPHSLRSQLWSLVLDSDANLWHTEIFLELKQLVVQYAMLVDSLVIKDVQLTVCNDDQYFVFEDLIYQVILCLSRDTTVASVFYQNSSNPILAVLKGKPSTINNTVIYPPNGIIPFHGFAMYVAPCCYVYDDPVKLYFTVRSYYLRYWFKLHEVSSQQQGILALCILFDQLLQHHEYQLWQHFRSLNVQPIRIVFKWIMRCFSGHLPPEQILYLWDLILAYDSLEIVPLVAVAILSFRKDNLLEIDTLNGIEAILADLSSIRVIPLLQFVLLK